MATGVIIMDAGGLPVTNLGAAGATPFTVNDNFGIGVTLVDVGGLPVTLLNEDGSLWTEGAEGAPEMQFDDAVNSQLLALLDDF